MSVYLDLSFLSHILLMVFAMTFVNAVDVSRFKTKGKILLIILSLPLVMTLYLSFALALVIMVVTNVIIFILLFKKQFILPLIEYLVAYYFVALFMALVSPYVAFRNLSIAILDIKGYLSMFVVPIAFLLLKIVSMMVDKIYHLGNYALNIVFNFNGAHCFIKGYFDTGNTLKYKGLPVIFFKRSAFPFTLPSNYEILEYETVNGVNNANVYKGSVIIDGTKESLVYFALVNNELSFNGCECLLNAYLGV